ncbi:hypothetical protein JYB64_21210, partial [Algoriphagus aestuarii]|nr:hypothetical protein [Algoriphagus aestuarii]
MTNINWGPTGQLVYERTYSRTKANGEKETWPETVERVVNGNMALVDSRYHMEGEREALVSAMRDFKILPAGRHLWASGVEGRQYLFNCHVSGWGEQITDHFEFTFMRLMEGGGVGSNYSNRFLEQYPKVQGNVTLKFLVREDHPDVEKLRAEGVKIGDSSANALYVEDSREGWADALVTLIRTHYEDGPERTLIFDVSNVREEGAP